MICFSLTVIVTNTVTVALDNLDFLYIDSQPHSHMASRSKPFTVKELERVGLHIQGSDQVNY